MARMIAHWECTHARCIEQVLVECPVLRQTHTQTGRQRHTLSHSQTHSHTHSLTHTLSHTLSHTHSHTQKHFHSFPLSHSLTHFLTHTHTHSLTLCHSHSLTTEDCEFWEMLQTFSRNMCPRMCSSLSSRNLVFNNNTKTNTFAGMFCGQMVGTLHLCIGTWGRWLERYTCVIGTWADDWNVTPVYWYVGR